MHTAHHFCTAYLALQQAKQAHQQAHFAVQQAIAYGKTGLAVLALQHKLVTSYQQLLAARQQFCRAYRSGTARKQLAKTYRLCRKARSKQPA